MYLKGGSTISIDIGIASKSIIEYMLSLEREFLKDVTYNITKDFGYSGFIVEDCTPWNEKLLSFGELSLFKVKKANNSSSNLHLSIEFINKREKGIKCFIGEKDFKEKKIAQNITNSFKDLGFLDLGIKYSDVYIITNTTMPLIILKIYCNILEFERDKERLIPSLSKTLVKSIISLGTI